MEHCPEDVVEAAVFALGRGSNSPSPIISTSSAYNLSSCSVRSMAEGCRRMYACVGLEESGKTGERTAESRSLVGARTQLRLRLPKLPKEELGEDLIEGVEDEVVEVMLPAERLFEEDLCRGLWLKMV